MKEPSKIHIKTVQIEETYQKIGKVVYYLWRFAGKGKKWNMRKTPFNEVPYVTYCYICGGLDGNHDKFMHKMNGDPLRKLK